MSIPRPPATRCRSPKRARARERHPPAIPPLRYLPAYGHMSRKLRSFRRNRCRAAQAHLMLSASSKSSNPSPINGDHQVLGCTDRSSNTNDEAPRGDRRSQRSTCASAIDGTGPIYSRSRACGVVMSRVRPNALRPPGGRPLPVGRGFLRPDGRPPPGGGRPLPAQREPPPPGVGLRPSGVDLPPPGVGLRPSGVDLPPL